MTAIIPLLSIFLVALGVIAVILWLIPWMIKRKIRKIIDQSHKEAEERAKRPSRNRRTSRVTIFTSDDGEYVEYEEIEASDTLNTAKEAYSGPFEPQISDAEWEDI